MKFIHTADWQIGMKAAHVGAVGDRVRQERLEAARRVVRAAKDHGAHFILIAGDTFENNAVQRVLVQKVADILGGFSGKVYIIPGNHDPCVPGSVWEHPAWQSHDNLEVLCAQEAVQVPGGTLYPCPLSEKHSPRDPTRWIDAHDETTIAVGVAHGSVEGIVQDELDYPIARNAAARAGLDYLALGHWHSTATYEADLGAVRMAYSGTHETTAFGERASGNVLLVEIGSRGDEPQLQTLRTGGLKWKQIEKEVLSEGHLAEVREGIQALEDPAITLLELRLSGVLHASEQADLARIEELAEARFLYSHVDRSGLLPEPQDDGWVAKLPVGPLQETARWLQRLSEPTVVEGRPENATPEVATQALLKLYAMLHEVSQ